MSKSVSFWRTLPGLCAILLLAALLFFLVTEHSAHFYGALPYVILLLCPLLHILMHKGHGAHGKQQTNPAETKPPEADGNHH